MRSLFRRLVSSRRATKSRRRSLPRRGRAMQLEALEDRQMLSWTVMLYMGADDKGPGNDLARSRVHEVALDIARMPSSTGDMNIVAQIDSVGFGTTDPLKLFDGEAGARRGRITGPGLPSNTWGTDLGNLDSANPLSLINFVQWAMASYPADHYALIVWGSGEGLGGVLRDDTSGTVLSMAELAAVADAIPHLDLIGFDAGRMGSAEVAAQWFGEADFLVASEADIPAPTPLDYATGYIGWDYRFLDTLRLDTSMTPEDLGKEIVSQFGAYYTPLALPNLSLAAVDLEALGDPTTGLIVKLGLFADAMLNVATQSDWDKFDEARDATAGFGAGMYDLGDMMARFHAASGVTDTVASAASAVLGAVTNAVVAKFVSALPAAPDAWASITGLSIYKPDLSSIDRNLEYYFNLSLLVDTNWLWVAVDFGPRRNTGVSFGADPLSPGHRAMFITGTAGDDTILVRQANGRLRVNGSFWKSGRNYGGGVRHVYVLAGAGNDTVAIGGPVSKSVVILGGAGNDNLRTNNRLGLLIGGEGNDMLVGGVGTNTIVGCVGNDSLYGGPGADNFYGGDGDDYVQGGAGHDWAAGGRGDDQLWGELGQDVLLGGRGNDVVTAGGDNDFITGGDGNDEVFGDAGNDLIYTGDGLNLAYGGDGNDRLHGGRQADVLWGDKGNDLVAGGGDADQVYGGGGRNMLLGGTGADQLFADSGADILIGGVTVHDGDDAALGAILTEWARAKYNRTTRIAHIANTSGIGANGRRYLRPNIDVFNDVVANELNYAGSSNWLINTANDHLIRTT